MYGGIGSSDRVNIDHYLQRKASFLTQVAVFSSLLQLLVYPHIAKHLGYRKTLQMGISIFIVCYMLLPFANRITGPVDTSPDGPCGNGTSADDLSGSRSGSGILDNATLDLNATDSNSTQYCTVDYEIGVNENSIVRVPLRVWALLLFVMTLLVMSRYTSIH